MKLYLAYGANTNFENMKTRCPAAKYICNITLNDHRLVFRKYADVVPARGSKVVCAVWLITPECEESLDVYEGFPRSYVKRYITVHLQGKRHRMMFYVMTRPGSRGEILPPESYEQCLREGYADCGMPERQIDNALRRAATWMKQHPQPVAPKAVTTVAPKAVTTVAPKISVSDSAADDFMMSVIDAQKGGQ